MQEILDNTKDDLYDEEWKVIVSTKGEYQLSKYKLEL